MQRYFAGGNCLNVEYSCYVPSKNKGVMELLTLMATLKVKTGKEAEVAGICAQLAKEVLAKEKDCLMYIPHVVKNDPTEIVFFEKYKDKEAFKAHGS